jgi:hypothetical protein
MRPVLLLLISVASASAGQVLFKKGVLAAGERTLRGPVIGELVRLVIHPLVFSGLILNAILTIADGPFQNDLELCLSLLRH